MGRTSQAADSKSKDPEAGKSRTYLWNRKVYATGASRARGKAARDELGDADKSGVMSDRKVFEFS